MAASLAFTLNAPESELEPALVGVALAGVTVTMLVDVIICPDIDDVVTN